MYSYNTYSYNMMSNVHLDNIIIAIPSDIQNHLSAYTSHISNHTSLLSNLSQ